MRRVVVTGSREGQYKPLVVDKIVSEVEAHGQIHIAHGGAAKGADRFAHEVAQDLELVESIFYARWSSEGKKAGPVRNSQMLREFGPDVVYAFWDEQSRGTRSCIAKAEELGIPVVITRVG